LSQTNFQKLDGCGLLGVAFLVGVAQSVLCW